MKPALEVKDLVKVYGGGLRKSTAVTALDGVSLEVHRGKTTAIVGESGSGKSTLAKCILGLAEPTSGTIEIEGLDPIKRGQHVPINLYRTVQMVFQDPHASLNPRMTVGAIVGEPLKRHLHMRPAARRARVAELLELVRLEPSHAERYPHQLSGGQRQRVGIARALAPNPKVLVLDEPTSSLDVSVRQHVLDLLVDIQRQLSLGYIFISHDLAVVRRLADHVHVMHRGKVVESATAEEVFSNPQHEYTRALLDAIPIPQWRESRRRHRIAAETAP